MPSLNVSQESTVTHFPGHHVRVIQGAFIGHVESFKLPEHAVFISHGETVANNCLANGEPSEIKVWPQGAIGFLPAAVELQVHLAAPNVRTWLRLDGALFNRVAAEHVDYDRVQWRYADITEPTTKALAGTLEHMTTTDGYREWPLLIESTATALAAAAVRVLSPEAAVGMRNQGLLSKSRRRRVIDFVEANLHRQITLAEMADAASLSPYHFARRFKSATGQTPLRFLAEQRAEAAKKLLKAGNMPLAEIALECGYAGQGHFTTKFKAVTGVTPGAYRATFRVLMALYLCAHSLSKAVAPVALPLA